MSGGHDDDLYDQSLEDDDQPCRCGRCAAYAAGVEAERATHAAFMREVREVLGGVEWVKDRRFSEMYCPSCHMYQIGGHQSDCRLAALLAKMKGVPNG